MPNDDVLQDGTEDQNSVETEVVTLPPAPLDYVTAKRIEEIKEKSAKIIALGLISILGISVVGVLIITWLILASGDGGPETGAKVTADNLKALGSFLSTVFSPLLAFVLGYYFSDRQQA